jgi:hypothetical protein
MHWTATKIGYALICAYLFSLVCSFGLDFAHDLVVLTRQALLLLPLLLCFDLVRYFCRCWRLDCLAD